MHRRTGRSFAALLTLPLLAGIAACTPADLVSPPGAQAVELRPFGSCDELLDYFREHALAEVGPWGFGHGHHYFSQGEMEFAAAADVDSATMSAGDAGGAGDFSGTNNQEVGVEEPDIVQTDGQIIVTTREAEVIVVDATSGQALATVPLPLPRRGQGYGDHELLLNRDTAQLLVLTREHLGGGWAYEASDDMVYTPAFSTERTVLTTVDLSEPRDPKVVGASRLEGGYRSARMIDGSVRVVLVTNPPGLSFTHPRTGSLTAETDAEAANRQIISQSTIEDWLPHLQTLDAGGTVTGTELVSRCDQVSRPPEFSGLATMSVVTLDLSSGAARPTSSTGLVANGSTIYSSPDRLVVATGAWDSWGWWMDTWPRGGGQGLNTALHTFDLTDPSSTRYVASGTVEGRLLNQFALSETDGVIRAAVTTEGRGRDDSQSSLVMLAEDGRQLVETGRLDGLGVTERIYSVRYLSPDLAAVVTFREVDPLYLIDTSDFSSPTLLGELKIPGYSAYLHPISETLLLGIGQDASEQGWTEGLQASLFDISDPSDPRRVDHLTWKNHHSEVEWDHRAFTYWPATGQFFLTANHWNNDGDWQGVLATTVDGDALVAGPSAQIGGTGTGWDYPRRTLVIDDTLWLLGENALYRHDLITLERQDTVDLRRPSA